MTTDADYVGFVFVKSKRQVTVTQMKNWLAQHPERTQKVVALFVNEHKQVIKDVVNEVNVDIIQCHGTESPDYIKELKKLVSCPVYKVIHVDNHTVENMRRYEGIADGFILDCKVKDAWGGTGESFDWSELPRFIKEGKNQGVYVFIAGGVRPDNVDDLVSYQPDGIDVSSGVETNGRKDKQKIEYLLERMKKYEHRKGHISRSAR